MNTWRSQKEGEETLLAAEDISVCRHAKGTQSAPAGACRSATSSRHPCPQRFPFRKTISGGDVFCARRVQHLSMSRHTVARPGRGTGIRPGNVRTRAGMPGTCRDSVALRRPRREALDSRARASGEVAMWSAAAFEPVLPGPRIQQQDRTCPQRPSPGRPLCRRPARCSRRPSRESWEKEPAWLLALCTCGTSAIARPTPRRLGELPWACSEMPLTVQLIRLSHRTLLHPQLLEALHADSQGPAAAAGAA